MFRPRLGCVVTILLLTLGTSSACTSSPAPEPTPDPTAARPATHQAKSAGAEEGAGAEASSEKEPVGEVPDPTADPAEPFGPMSPEMKAAFMAGEEEDTTPMTPETYIQSNETRHDLWFPYIRDRGGAFVGIGSDQSFTLLAVQKAEVAFIFDIDKRVVDLHRVYRLFILESETPQAHLEMWRASRKDEIEALLEERFADLDATHRSKLIRNYKSSRETVERHLERVIARKQGGQPTSWLSDPALYEHLRTLYQNDRIRILDGDLTGPKTMLTIGKAAAEIGQPVRVFYLSNAEEYYDYSPQYAKNVGSLPGEPESVALRTIYNKSWEHAGLWNYQVQALGDYQARLANTLNRRRNAMLRRAEQAKVVERTTDVKGLSRVACPAPGCAYEVGAEQAGPPN